MIYNSLNRFIIEKRYTHDPARNIPIMRVYDIL